MTRRDAVVAGGLIFTHLLLRVGFGLENQVPDLMLLALLLASRSLSLRAGAGLGFVLGVVEDSFSMLSFGASVFAMTLVGAAGAQVRHLFVGRSIFFHSTYFLLGKWVRDFLSWIVSDASSRGGFVDRVLIESPLASLYVAAAGVAIRLLLTRESNRR